jgi:hypothetical protein
MADNPLRSYLIELGFDVDNVSQKRMQDAVREGTIQANLLFDALSGMVEQFTATVDAWSKKLTDLYWSSRIFKETAGNLDALEQAAQRVGVSADKADALFKTFATNIRTNPGLRALAAYLSGMSQAAFNALSPTEQLFDVVHGLGKFQGPTGDLLQKEFAEKFGIDFETLKRLQDPDFLKALADVRDTAKQTGVNFGASTKAAKELNDQMLALGTTLHDMSAEIGDGFAGPLTKGLRGLDEFLKGHAKEIEGYLTDINTVAVAGVAFIGSITAGLAKLFGLAAPAWFTPLMAAIAVWQGNKIASGGASTTDISGRVGTDLQTDIQGWKNLFGGGGTPAAPAPAAPTDDRNLWQKYAPSWLGGQPAPSSAPRGPQEGATAGKWWTPDRQAHAVQRLMKEAGLSEQGARALVARWATVESPHGPASVNPYSGAFGIEQDLGARKAGIAGDTNFDDQLAHAINQLNSTESRAARMLRSNDPWTAAAGASQYERAEGYDPRTGTDNFTNRIYGAMSHIFITPAQAAEISKRLAAPSGPPVGGGSLSSLFDTRALGAFSATAHTIDNSTQNNPTLHQKTTLNIYGVGEGNEEIGAKLTRRQASKELLAAIPFYLERLSVVRPAPQEAGRIAA